MESVSHIFLFVLGRSAVSSTASLKWTPMSEQLQRRPDDGPTSMQPPVAGISVLKRDKPTDSQLTSDNLSHSTAMNDRTSDSHANAVDFTDIENSLSDVSSSLRAFAVTVITTVRRIYVS